MSGLGLRVKKNTYLENNRIGFIPLSTVGTISFHGFSEGSDIIRDMGEQNSAKILPMEADFMESHLQN